MSERTPVSFVRLWDRGPDLVRHARSLGAIRRGKFAEIPFVRISFLITLYCKKLFSKVSSVVFKTHMSTPRRFYRRFGRISNWQIVNLLTSKNVSWEMSNICWKFKEYIFFFFLDKYFFLIESRARSVSVITDFANEAIRSTAHVAFSLRVLIRSISSIFRPTSKKKPQATRSLCRQRYVGKRPRETAMRNVYSCV